MLLLVILEEDGYGFTTYDGNNLITSNLATGAKVSVKSIPSCVL